MAMQECRRCGGGFDRWDVECYYCGFPAPPPPRWGRRFLVVFTVAALVLVTPVAGVLGLSLYQASREPAMALDRAASAPATSAEALAPEPPSPTAPATEVAPTPAPSRPAQAPPAKPGTGIVNVPSLWLPENLVDPDGTGAKRLNSFADKLAP